MLRNISARFGLVRSLAVASERHRTLFSNKTDEKSVVYSDLNGVRLCVLRVDRAGGQDQPTHQEQRGESSRGVRAVGGRGFTSKAHRQKSRRIPHLYLISTFECFELSTADDKLVFMSRLNSTPNGTVLYARMSGRFKDSTKRFYVIYK